MLAVVSSFVRWSAVAALPLLSGACTDEFPLGAWTSGGRGGSSGAPNVGGTTGGGGLSSSGGMSDIGGGAAGADGTAGSAAAGMPGMLPECGASAPPGELNAAGTTTGATETFTYWTWPSPIDSLEWELVIERESAREIPVNGYYYAHQFQFVGGIAGFIGLQAKGVYQANPPDGPAEFTKIAVFWLSGPPLDGETGDIVFPDARYAPASQSGLEWGTIHARFPWEVCHTYHFRLARQSTDVDGNIWYGAWIEDRTDGVETFLGRMLLRGDTGQLAGYSTTRSWPIAAPLAQTCEQVEYSSALFGMLSANGGTVRPSFHTNDVVSPPRCGTSRFTDFESAVRQEVGVAGN